MEDMKQMGIQTRQSVAVYDSLRPDLSNDMLIPEQMHRQQKLK